MRARATTQEGRTRPVAASAGYRWFVLAVFFLFMLLHQTDQLMTSPMHTPIADRGAFFAWLALAAVFMPLSLPNVVATVYDIVVPEVRSTAQAIEYFAENIGAASAPVLAGFLSVRYGKGSAILWTCLVAWLMCFLLYTGALFTVEADVQALRSRMGARAQARPT